MLRCCGSTRLALRAAFRAQRRSPVSSPAARHAVSAAAAAPGEPRSRLNEACLARSLVRSWECDGGSGPSHAPLFTCSVRVTAATGGPVLAEGTGGGSTRGAAQDAAAAAALACMDVLASAPSSELEALAWVGDAAFDALLGLLAYGRGLSAAQCDVIRQRLANNAALGGGAPGRAAATTVEAAVGAQVLRDADALRPLLLAAVRRGAPSLAKELEAAVAGAAPERVT
jgi:hypothetical protein